MSETTKVLSFRAFPALFAAAVLAVALAGPAAAAEFAGEFEGDGLHLALEPDGEVYLGALQMGDEIYLCRAGRDGAGLSGVLEGAEGEVPFELRSTGRGLVLSFGGASFDLYPLGEGPGAGDPLAGGARPPVPPSDAGAARPTEPGAAAAAASGLAGRYRGSIQGTPAVLTLDVEGGRVSGQIDASGYLYNLAGTGSGNQASGEGSDPQTGGKFPYQLSVDGDALRFVILAQDPYTGQQQPQLTLDFRREGAGGPQIGAGGGAGGLQQGAVPAGPRDPALVGVWRQSESMSGGDATMVVESFLTVNADGTFAVGQGRAIGGGPGWGGDTGSGGVEERGYWKTENRIVWVQSPGTGQWQPYARYYVEPQKLMFTFDDGSRQILFRVR